MDAIKSPGKHEGFKSPSKPEAFRSPGRSESKFSAEAESKQDGDHSTHNSSGNHHNQGNHTGAKTSAMELTAGSEDTLSRGNLIAEFL
eukprot:gene32585-39398_t